MSADVDIVMMSKATTPQLREMTCYAVRSAINGAGAWKVNPIVMEQMQVEYADATTVYKPGRFNYNRFANEGAKRGSAPWILFCNNDLHFGFGWLNHLMAAGHAVMSPISPGCHRQRDVYGIEAGWEVGRHLAGWCFMMSRRLWEQLGGLDETYDFWCSDNAVMDQLRAKGIAPVLVPKSVVHHDVSVTLMREPWEVQEELTFAPVDEYNATAAEKICQNHPGYLAWKRRNELR